MATPSAAVFTFLFTDIEGSTPLWEHYPEAMPAALAEHDAILREAIESHGGRVFKTVGDAALDVAHEARKPDFPKFTAFYFLDDVAGTLAVQGRADAAARFLGAFDAQFEAFLAEGLTRDRLLDAIDLQEHDHYLALCRAQLDAAAFDRCRQEGRALALEEAVELARGCTKNLAEKVTPAIN